MGFILEIIMGGLIGWLASVILHKDESMGKLANIVAGLVGSALGGSLFGNFGPVMFNIAIIPALLGAIIVIAIVSFFTGRK